MKKIILSLVLAAILAVPLCAQTVSVRTNIVHGVALTPNLSVETGLGMKTSLNLLGAYNWFEFSGNKRWKHWLIQPEGRWWFCERFNGSFVGVHLHGGEFSVGGVGPFKILKKYRHEGWFYGAGVSYGHQWMLSNRFAFELELGVGYARIIYDRYPCEDCAPKIKSGKYNYFGPTKIEASLVFFLW